MVDMDHTVLPILVVNYGHAVIEYSYMSKYRSCTLI